MAASSARRCSGPIFAPGAHCHCPRPKLRHSLWLASPQRSERGPTARAAAATPSTIESLACSIGHTRRPLSSSTALPVPSSTMAIAHASKRASLPATASTEQPQRPASSTCPHAQQRHRKENETRRTTATSSRTDGGTLTCSESCSIVRPPPAPAGATSSPSGRGRAARTWMPDCGLRARYLLPAPSLDQRSLTRVSSKLAPGSRPAGSRTLERSDR
mmetsp:Transcript_49470/g.160317  ORF Transcript_49470/g.160317 Transcript_49470/m.160317 type:complete len:217 (+) Transcript_49470:289-939(+)